MNDANDELLTKPYKPHVTYNSDEDRSDHYIEYCSEDAACYFERIDDTLELIRRMDTKKIIGARIYARVSLQIGDED